jgi:hypothetical protein
MLLVLFCVVGLCFLGSCWTAGFVSSWPYNLYLYYCVCGDVGREVIRLTHFQGQSQGQGPYLLLTPYTHGVPHVDCEGPCAVAKGSCITGSGFHLFQHVQRDAILPDIFLFCVACCSIHVRISSHAMSVATSGQWAAQTVTATHTASQQLNTSHPYLSCYTPISQ